MGRVNEELRVQLERVVSRGEADRARSAAERDGLAAELRSSADLREQLRARNEELEGEMGALREAVAKKGSPLRWRRAPKQQSSETTTALGGAGGGGGSEVGPMTKQRALFSTKSGKSGGVAAASEWCDDEQQQHHVAAGQPVRGVSSDSGDVTAQVRLRAGGCWGVSLLA